jgi:hypothetical protein
VALTPEQKKQFEDVFETLNSEGWKIILADITATCKGLEEHGWESCEESKDFYIVKGKIRAYREFQSYRDTMELLYEQHSEESDDGSEDL